MCRFKCAQEKADGRCQVREKRTSLRRRGRLGLGSGAMGIRKDSSSTATGGKAGTDAVHWRGENPSELASVTQERLQPPREGSEVEERTRSVCRSCWATKGGGDSREEKSPCRMSARESHRWDSKHSWPLPNDTENTNENPTALSRPREKSHLQYGKIR